MDRRLYELFKSISTLFDKLLSRDYVVEQGKDSTTGFFYRKWNSGVAECWMRWEDTITPYADTFVGNVKYGYSHYFTLPFKIAEYACNVNALVGTGAAEIFQVRPISNTQVYVIWAGGQTNVKSTLEISIKGRWKKLQTIE